jgi:hypothetical protein
MLNRHRSAQMCGSARRCGFDEKDRFALWDGSAVWHAADMAITRMWRGWTKHIAADDYERFLLQELFPSMRSIPGFLGADVLRRPDGNEVAFVTLTRFASLDDIRAFAGEPMDVPVIEPQAAQLLVRFDDRAAHYETAVFRT